MISVQEAEQLVAQYSAPTAPVACPLQDASGRILREDVPADRDHPPFPRVMMDGIAISAQARASGQTTFRIEATQAAGTPPRRLKNPEACIQVMTGAVLPDGCDSVIPYEDLAQREPCATLNPGLSLSTRQWVHEQGADGRQGDILLKAGAVLHSPQIALLAAAGRTQVLTGCPPSVAIVSTGDELVEIGCEIQAHQIRPSNAYGMQAALQRAGANRIALRLSPDDPHRLREGLGESLAAHEVLIVSGGVSMGKYDYVPAVLEQLSVRPLFHKIRQRPGKPFWFGLAAGGRRVFALPGNPLSSLICFHRYVLPSLYRSMGAAPLPGWRVRLGESVEGGGELTRFIPARLNPDLEATPLAHHGSGDLPALAESTGFIELPEGMGRFEKGDAVVYHPWH